MPESYWIHKVSLDTYSLLAPKMLVYMLRKLRFVELKNVKFGALGVWLRLPFLNSKLFKIAVTIFEISKHENVGNKN